MQNVASLFMNMYYVQFELRTVGVQAISKELRAQRFGLQILWMKVCRTQDSGCFGFEALSAVEIQGLLWVDSGPSWVLHDRPCIRANTGKRTPSN